jgi:hypothetical protein
MSNFFQHNTNNNKLNVGRSKCQSVTKNNRDISKGHHDYSVTPFNLIKQLSISPRKGTN